MSKIHGESEWQKSLVFRKRKGATVYGTSHYDDLTILLAEASGISPECIRDGAIMLKKMLSRQLA